MFGERVAVGHAGNEIRDVAGVSTRAGLWRLLAPFNRKCRRFAAVSLEKLRHDILGIAHDAHDAGVAVDAGEPEDTQRVELALHDFSEGNPRARRAANIVRALWP